MLNSTSSNLPRSCLRPTSSARTSCDAIDLACTGWNHPIRSSCASAHASLRSVFTVIADNPAFTCRVSSRTVSNPASFNPACSRQWPSLKSDPLHCKAKFFQKINKGLWLARDLRLLHDLAPPIHNANAREFQRDADSCIVFHGRPPSQMPGADSTS
jgi:hypothetical protein